MKGQKMRVMLLEIHNVGMIDNMSLRLDKPLILFYGEVRQGKTTILNAVRWCLGAAFPSDLIRHGCDDASVRLALDNGSVTRSWYRNKTGETVARPIQFVQAGQLLAKPAEAIKKFLNPFLLDQDHLRNMGEAERKRFFLELLDVDTGQLDAQVLALEGNARDYRAKIKAYGDIDVTEVAKPDLVALEAKRSGIVSANKLGELHAAEANVKANADWARECQSVTAMNAAARKGVDDRNAVKAAEWKAENDRVTAENAEIVAHNYRRKSRWDKLQEKQAEVMRLEAALAAAREDVAGILQWIEDPMNATKDLILVSPAPVKEDAPPAAAMPTPPMPTVFTPESLAEVDKEIFAAHQQHGRYVVYVANVAKLAEKRAAEKKLAEMENEVKRLRAEKIAKLAGVAAECGIPGLKFDADGNFTYQNTDAGMLSTSQLMELSTVLCGLYPPGFGLDLVDRAESLGKNVLLLVDRAKREDKTILATIVGEKPATMPEDVGVWVVDGGKVTK